MAAITQQQRNPLSTDREARADQQRIDSAKEMPLSSVLSHDGLKELDQATWAARRKEKRNQDAGELFEKSRQQALSAVTLPPYTPESLPHGVAALQRHGERLTSLADPSRANERSDGATGALASFIGNARSLMSRINGADRA
ncbi:MAG: hypothetical protein KDD69_04560 [Bdellovibrionales bacterium]|nr:hypothetical protein [Bdellovibrionales bacterium]